MTEPLARMNDLEARDYAIATTDCTQCESVAGKRCVEMVCGVLSRQPWVHVGRLKAAGVDLWWLRAHDLILAAVRERGADAVTDDIETVLAGVAPRLGG